MKQLELRRAGIVPALLLGMTGAVALPGCGGTGSSGGSVAGSGSDVLATVSGTDITRDQLRDYLEGSQGQQALRTLINQQLLEQSLKAKGVTISDKDVDDALQDYLKSLQKQDAITPVGSTSPYKQLQTVITQGGAPLNAVKNALRARLVNVRLLTKDVKATDAQVKAWFDKNHTTYDTPGSVDWGILAASTQVRAKTMYTQLTNKSRTFQQLVDEQHKAQDAFARQSFPSRPADPNELPPQFKAPLLKSKPGGFTNIITLPAGPGKSLFAILTLVKNTPLQKADFNSIKARVTDDYKLQQLASTLPASPPSAMGSTTSPLDTKQQQVLDELSHAGNVIVKNQSYAPVAEGYKPAPSSTTGNTVTGNSTTGSASGANTATGNAAG